MSEYALNILTAAEPLTLFAPDGLVCWSVDLLSLQYNDNYQLLLSVTMSISTVHLRAQYVIYGLAFFFSLFEVIFETKKPKTKKM